MLALPAFSSLIDAELNYMFRSELFCGTDTTSDDPLNMISNGMARHVSVAGPLQGTTSKGGGASKDGWLSGFRPDSSRSVRPESGRSTVNAGSGGSAFVRIAHNSVDRRVSVMNPRKSSAMVARASISCHRKSVAYKSQLIMGGNLAENNNSQNGNGEANGDRTGERASTTDEDAKKNVSQTGEAGDPDSESQPIAPMPKALRRK
jgi:hypothetical protein